MLNNLLQYVLTREGWAATEEVIVITDKLPIYRKRKAVEKGIKTSLSRLLPARGEGYVSCITIPVPTMGCRWPITVLGDQSKVADPGKRSWYNLIKPALHSEYDIFQSGSIIYY